MTSYYESTILFGIGIESESTELRYAVPKNGTSTSPGAYKSQTTKWLGNLGFKTSGSGYVKVS